jgi:hypothetical protein
MSKSFMALIRDHSGSMGRIARPAMNDYNGLIASIAAATAASGQETIVSVLELGYGTTTDVRAVIDGQPVQALTPISSYSTSGGTPLWDAVGDAIDNLLKQPGADDPEAAFLVSLTTDGRDEHSKRWSSGRAIAKMEQLIATDRWTFTFRVPANEVKNLIRLGVHEGNILPWEQTQRGVEVAQAHATAAFTDYLSGRSKGMKSTKRFYANMAEVKIEDVKAALVNVGAEVQLLPVGPAEHEQAIREFVETRIGGKMLKGAAFYQLTKSELKVQGYKLIAVRNQKTGEVFAGPAARQLVGLPNVDTKLSPDNLGEWDVFIQSTSVNRKVVAGTNVLYWQNVGRHFKEGKSA